MGTGGQKRPYPAEASSTASFSTAAAAKNSQGGRSRLFVGNIPSDLTQDEFQRLFNNYGELVEYYVNPSRGFGFIKLVCLASGHRNSWRASICLSFRLHDRSLNEPNRISMVISSVANPCAFALLARARSSKWKTFPSMSPMNYWKTPLRSILVLSNAQWSSSMIEGDPSAKASSNLRRNQAHKSVSTNAPNDVSSSRGTSHRA